MANETGTDARAEWREIDIGSEETRYYHYSYGITEGVFRIDNPARLYVKSDDHGDSHRVVTESGFTYMPARGWVGVSWRPKADQPAFVA